MTKISSALPDFFQALQQATGGDVRTDETSRTLYSTDASLYQVMPLGVCFPRDTAEVQAIVTLADQYEIPLLPRAGGTGLAGQTVNEALVIDMSHHMNQLLEVNVEERWARVQPGLVFAHMNSQLKQHGLMFGPDPASGNRAGLGGIVGNNATGSHSILYGMAADHVMGVEAVLADHAVVDFSTRSSSELGRYLDRPGIEGAAYNKLHSIARDHSETVRTGTPKHWRRCGGYNLFRFLPAAAGVPESPYARRDFGTFNLAQLMTGSEGTLGVMTEFKLNLVPTPKMTALAIVHFDDAYTCLDATQVILETGPSAVELLDQYTISLCQEHTTYKKYLERFLVGQPNSVLVTEYYGESEGELKDKIEKLQTHLNKRGVRFSAVVPLLTSAEQAPVWTVRKAGLGLLMSKRGDYKPATFIEDTAVPVEHLADYITGLIDFCADLDVDMAYYAHASGGCIHTRPLVNTKSADDRHKMEQISRYTLAEMKKYGGSFSSEHGDGRSRSWLNEEFFGPDLFQLFREVKETFDPKNLFNPGNIVVGQPLTDNLRMGADYTNVTFHETLDFSEDQGFHRAIEMCNGAGVCRKLTGTMCPPYMVTRDEEHSTRGRANMLRAALTGKLPAERLTGQRMYETMDLCISCKACKSECPSSVDMAKIKMQFLDHYYKANGVPRRAKLFGNIHRLNRFMSGGMAPLANWVTERPLVKRVNQRLFNISAKRDLPRFARETYLDWFRKRERRDATAARLHEVNSNVLKSSVSHQIVFFNDTFNTYNDPHVSIAATEVLEAAGFELLLPGHTCCGRPMLSKGLVEDARLLAIETIDKLYPYAVQGLPIVGLEPSCLLSFRDDYLYLLPNDYQKKVRVVAERAYLFEEFLAELAEKNELNLTFKQEPKEVLLHGHCHQKSLAGTETAKKVLALPGYKVTEVDSGCCGMAGSFGYEAEHTEISLQMGERALFPAVRATDEQTIIAAAGTSCREQIWDGTGRRALHPAEVLRNALAER